MSAAEVVGRHLAATREVLSACESLTEDVERAAELLWTALSSGGKVVWCGNGGSAVDAQHLSAELVGRYALDRPGLASITLTSDIAVVTALANDFGYDHVFARQVEALCRPPDVLVILTTSGRSPNVVRAAEAAHAQGVRVLAFTGDAPSPLHDLADVVLRVPSLRTPQIQEAQKSIGHALCEWLEALSCR